MESDGDRARCRGVRRGATGLIGPVRGPAGLRRGPTPRGVAGRRPDREPAARGAGPGCRALDPGRAPRARRLRQLRSGYARPGPGRAERRVRYALDRVLRSLPPDGARGSGIGARPERAKLMRYVVLVAGKRFAVDLGPEGASVDGRPVEVTLRHADETPVRGLIVGTEACRVVGERGARGRWKVGLHGRSHDLEVVDERTMA